MIITEFDDPYSILIESFRNFFINFKRTLKKREDDSDLTFVHRFYTESTIKIKSELNKSLIRCILTVNDEFLHNGFKITPKCMKNLFYNLFIYTNIFDSFLDNDLETIIDGSLPFSTYSNIEYYKTLNNASKKAFHSFYANEHTL